MAGDAQVARVSGFVSAPRDRRTSRDSQYLFVNGRFVRDRLIGRALSEGYRSILPHGVYPAALLFIEMPLEEVDVNVHPAKTEVRFRRQAAVADAVREAVRAALASASYVPPPEPPKIPEPIMTATAAVSSIAPQPRIEFVPPPPPIPAPPPVPVEPSGEEIARDIEVMIQSVSKSVPSASLPPLNSADKFAREVTPESLNANIRPLGQLDESFIIATDDEGLLLIDQHVAHERILFDKYRALESDARTEVAAAADSGDF